MDTRPSEKLNSLLFKEGRELVNIKFFPGTDRGLTKAQLQEAGEIALRSALDGGLVNNPPVSGRKKAKLG